MKTLKQLVEEYNALTGENVKRFPDRATAERRLAKAKEGVQTFTPLTRHQPCAVEVSGEHLEGSQRYDTTLQAFKALELPLGQHQRFRKELRQKGAAVFNGAVHFKVVL